MRWYIVINQQEMIVRYRYIVFHSDSIIRNFQDFFHEIYIYNLCQTKI